MRINKLEEAKQILKSLGLPNKQQNERSALTLLALCNLKEKDKWNNAKQLSMSVVGSKKNAKYPGIMRFISKHYKKHYAENSRETFRRQTLHQFMQAGVIEHNPENPMLPTNSKDNHYRLTTEALKVIRAFRTRKWEKEVEEFERKVGSLRIKYEANRERLKIPLKLTDGSILKFSPGKHNEVQIAVIKEFAPIFAPGSILLYVGDTANKNLYIAAKELEKLGIPIEKQNKLPDVLLYYKKRKWLFLIEAVTSHGPVSPKRIIELEILFKDCNLGKVYVSAFPDVKEFKRHMNNIAWETEVWIKDIPDHMIHFNGDRFIGPR